MTIRSTSDPRRKCCVIVIAITTSTAAVYKSFVESVEYKEMKQIFDLLWQSGGSKWLNSSDQLNRCSDRSRPGRGFKSSRPLLSSAPNESVPPAARRSAHSTLLHTARRLALARRMWDEYRSDHLPNQISRALRSVMPELIRIIVEYS